MAIFDDPNSNIFVRRISRTHPMQAKMTRKSNMFKTKKKEYKATVLSGNSNDWLIQLTRNIKLVEDEIGDSPWAKDLLKFIEKEQHNFQTGKFMGEMFNLKFLIG